MAAPGRRVEPRGDLRPDSPRCRRDGDASAADRMGGGTTAGATRRRDAAGGAEAEGAKMEEGSAKTMEPKG